MVGKLTYAFALFAFLLGPAWESSARVRADDQDLVRQYLDNRGATGYTIEAITDDYVTNTFPGFTFFGVWFRQYPIAVTHPPWLSNSNVFFVVHHTDVGYLTSPGELEQFFFDELAPVADEDRAKDAGRTWLRLSEYFSQDGFYRFSDPVVEFTPQPDGGGLVTGQVDVVAGGRGQISVAMLFDADGNLTDVAETCQVRPGIRPICQATKLLDADPLVRRMAEQDILVMGKAAKQYLDEQRAKAKPDLQQAIDRIWKRILDEGW